MNRQVSSQDGTAFEREYLLRWQSVRAQLRSLQLEASRLHPKQNKAPLTRLKMQIEAVDIAWDAMNAGRPSSKQKQPKADDRAIEKGLIDVAALTPEDLAEYGHK